MGRDGVEGGGGLVSGGDTLLSTGSGFTRETIIDGILHTACLFLSVSLYFCPFVSLSASLYFLPCLSYVCVLFRTSFILGNHKAT